MSNVFWLELNEAAQVARLAHLTAEHVTHAFAANYLAALVLMRLHDIEAARLLHDAAGSRLTGFTSKMSDPNFWGYVTFFPKDKLVRAKLGDAEADRLYDMARWVSESGARKALHLLQTPPDLVNWEQAYYTLALINDRFQLQSTFLARAASYLRTWKHRSHVERMLAVSNAFQYLLQSDPRSSLLPRLRDLAQGELARQSVSSPLAGFFRMSEDAVSSGTSAASVGSVGVSVGAAPNVSSNAIVTPPTFDPNSASGRDTQNNKAPASTLADLYRAKLGKRAAARRVSKKIHAKDAKLKGVQKSDHKVVKRRRRNYLPRQFKDPELNTVLGDHSDVRIA